jgi:hypothetical protein
MRIYARGAPGGGHGHHHSHSPARTFAGAGQEAARCATNLRGAGQAQFQYLNDHRRTFPQLITWNMLFGNKGENIYGEHGYDTAVHWPLNPYLGITSNNATVRIAECPSDAGDAFNNRGHGYTAHGTSYLTAFYWHFFRVKMVYGYAPEGKPSMKSSQFVKNYNKVLLADWIWHANRPLTDPRTKWHSNDKRLLNTLFADYHVELLDWVNEYLEFPPYNDYNATPPDPNYIFW